MEVAWPTGWLGVFAFLKFLAFPFTILLP
eukprot:COSAG01_NODE_34955_length_539_cov_1.054545_2_plen_28_part_01